jgi:hypothetical protein
MSWIGAYFSWAAGLSTIDGGQSIGSLLLAGIFLLVVPAVALLAAVMALTWVLSISKALGGAFLKGYRDSRNA